jgi:hypothetical protein
MQRIGAILSVHSSALQLLSIRCVYSASIPCINLIGIRSPIITRRPAPSSRGAPLPNPRQTVPGCRFGCLLVALRNGALRCLNLPDYLPHHPPTARSDRPRLLDGLLHPAENLRRGRPGRVRLTSSPTGSISIRSIAYHHVSSVSACTSATMATVGPPRLAEWRCLRRRQSILRSRPFRYRHLHRRGPPVAGLSFCNQRASKKYTP